MDPWRPLLPDLSERDDRDELEEPDRLLLDPEEREVDELDLEL